MDINLTDPQVRTLCLLFFILNEFAQHYFSRPKLRLYLYIFVFCFFPQGYTSLHKAAAWGRINAITCLLENDADIWYASFV